MHPSNVRTSSTPASSSGLRPRTTRLISGLDDPDAPEPSTSTPTTRTASRLASPLGSRGASPIPAERLSRTTTRASGRGDSSPGAALAGLWGTSWSTLQGLANDLLGESGNGGAGTGAGEGRGSVRTRRPLSRLQAERGGSSSAPPREWGPQDGARDIGGGSREEVEREVRARKRRDLLQRREPSYQDARGGWKRRTSDEGLLDGGVGEEQGRDALVYLHRVLKGDTLAGITIRYNCSANALRRANRMWPNDTVQSRRVLVLPVDACGAKGKPLSETEAADLLGNENGIAPPSVAAEVAAPLPNGNNPTRDRTNSASTSTSTLPSTAALSSASTDAGAPYIHDSWVVLPSSPHPTEIARLSRQNLAFFPPARRKSGTYSQPATSQHSYAPSPSSTPSTSLDLSRAHSNTTGPTSAPSPQRPPRTRKLSNASTGYFPSYLAGPGGVGSMHKTVSSPGPAQDPLNKLFARHLPDVAPPKNQQHLYQPEFPLYTDAGTPIGGSGSATPNAVGSLNVGFENFGGAVEGWMRKVAAKAQSAMEGDGGRVGQRVSVGAPGRGRNGVGDLIEMTDEFEIGGEDEYEGNELGRRVDGVGASGGEPSGFLAGAGGSGARMREGVGKGGKGD